MDYIPHHFKRAAVVNLDVSNGLLDLSKHPNDVIGESDIYITDDDSRQSLKDSQDYIYSKLNVKTDKSLLESDKLGKIFFTKDVCIPRYKVREIKDKYNLSIVRNPESADTIVISSDEILNNSRYEGTRYFFSKTDILFLFNSMIENVEKFSLSKESIRESISVIESLWHDVENLGFIYRDKIRIESYADKLGLSLNYDRKVYSFTFNYVQSLKKFENKNLITDSVLQSILGSSGLDHESYLFINTLLSSNDPGNIKLGLTMMANCNFEESQHYLLLLLKDYYPRDRYLGYTKSVAFKSLMTFLDFTRYSNVSYDDVLSKADSINKLTDEFTALIKKRIMDEYEHMLSRYKWAKITDIIIQKP